MANKQLKLLPAGLDLFFPSSDPSTVIIDFADADGNALDVSAWSLASSIGLLEVVSDSSISVTFTPTSSGWARWTLSRLSPSPRPLITGRVNFSSHRAADGPHRRELRVIDESAPINLEVFGGVGGGGGGTLTIRENGVLIGGASTLDFHGLSTSVSGGVATITHIPQEVAHTHDQPTPASTWVIPHSLDFHPSVTAVDTAGSKFYGQVAYPDPQTVVVTFSAAFAGRAYLS